MPLRSETPFERRERLNLETAIALSANPGSNLTSQIESGSTAPVIDFPAGLIIPNSQSDDDSIQQFTTIANSSRASRLSPPTTVILPVHTSSMDCGMATEAREPGWSMEKFCHSTSSTDNLSSRPNCKPPHSSSSSLYHPQPIILAAASSGSSTSPSVAKVHPFLISPSVNEEVCDQLIKLPKYTDSSGNLRISSVAPPSLPQVLPHGNLPDVPNQTSIPDIQIIAADPHLRTSNEQPSNQSDAIVPKKRRKIKAQEDTESIHAECKQGSSNTNLNLDGVGKRIRKQSSAGKASANTLKILADLSQPAKEPKVQVSQVKEPDPMDGSKKPRRRVFRDGWVLVSDTVPEAGPNPQLPISASVDNQRSVLEDQEAHQEICQPPEIPISKKPSQSFLEVISSPLSSPSGFSADEKFSKASKNSKSSVAKKPGPKKKAAPKAKIKKGRKKESLKETDPNDTIPVTIDEESPDKSINKPSNLQIPITIDNSESGLNVVRKAGNPKNQSNSESIMPSSPGRTLADKINSNQKVISEKQTTLVTEQLENTHQPQPSSSKSVQPAPSHNTNSACTVRKVENTKKNMQLKKNHKGLSLAEILASTNPKTKRPLRIGLPKEEKHRLHININPKPVVQKQVKKKLKVKRGEYDSGEDDQQSKNDSSNSDVENDDKQKSKRSTNSQNHCSDKEHVDDEGQDMDEKSALEDEDH